MSKELLPDAQAKPRQESPVKWEITIKMREDGTINFGREGVINVIEMAGAVSHYAWMLHRDLDTATKGAT